MELVLDANKTVEQNAGMYFEKGKKFKRKIPGIINTLELYRSRYAKGEINIRESEVKEHKSKREWFEKYRWFISSDGFLVIGGRDATTNEILVKKHTENGDLIFHAELPGSPFVIIKNPEKKDIPKTTLTEAAELCATYSKSWNAGRSTAEVYYVTPEQVTKETPTGMAGLAKGAFMILGKREYIEARLNLALCSFEGKTMGGPVSAIKNITEKALKKHTENHLEDSSKAISSEKYPKSSFVEIISGTDKTSDVAKKVQRKIGGDLDEIVRTLPPGCSIKKQ